MQTVNKREKWLFLYQTKWTFENCHKGQRRSLYNDIQEDITNIKIYALNIRDSKYIKKILRTLKEEDNNTVTIEFNIPFQTMDRSSKRKPI